MLSQVNHEASSISRCGQNDFGRHPQRLDAVRLGWFHLSISPNAVVLQLTKEPTS